jgi:hypothetical protein
MGLGTDLIATLAWKPFKSVNGLGTDLIAALVWNPFKSVMGWGPI